MSSGIVSAIWNYKGDDLNGTQTAIFVRMAWYASDAGRDIFPSVATLCTQTKFKETAVRDTIKYLIEKQFLIRMITSKGRHTNNYKINLDKLKVINEFNENSSKVEEQSAKRASPNEPFAKRGVNPSPDEPNPSPGDTIKTKKDESKNNNNVVDEKMVRKALGLGIKEFELMCLIQANTRQKVEFHLEGLARAKGVSHPIGWLTDAIKRDYQPRHGTVTNIGAAITKIWNENEYRQQCKEAEKLSDPNDWREKMISSMLKK